MIWIITDPVKSVIRNLNIEKQFFKRALKRKCLFTLSDSRVIYELC